jgi:hypothetical protein
VQLFLPAKEGESAREFLISHSIRVSVESARRRQPSSVASARQRMRAEKRHGSA